MKRTQADLERVVGFYEDSALTPPIYETYGLSSANQAFADMANRELVGNVLIPLKRSDVDQSTNKPVLVQPIAERLEYKDNY